MGNYVSKINKDFFFAFEEEMKNNSPFFKEKTRSGLEMCARGKTNTRFHSIKNFSKMMALTPLQTGMW